MNELVPILGMPCFDDEAFPQLLGAIHLSKADMALFKTLIAIGDFHVTFINTDADLARFPELCAEHSHLGDLLGYAKRGISHPEVRKSLSKVIRRINKQWILSKAGPYAAKYVQFVDSPFAYGWAGFHTIYINLRLVEWELASIPLPARKDYILMSIGMVAAHESCHVEVRTFAKDFNQSTPRLSKQYGGDVEESGFQLEGILFNTYTDKQIAINWGKTYAHGRDVHRYVVAFTETAPGIYPAWPTAQPRDYSVRKKFVIDGIRSGTGFMMAFRSSN